MATEVHPRLAFGDEESPTRDHQLPDELTIELLVRDRDTIECLCDYEEGPPREDYAAHALRIGVLALRHARGQLDADLVRRESQQMLTELQGHLGKHSHSVQDRLTTTLREYFDPDNGRFEQRVKRLISRDGELEQVLRRQIGCEDSQLSKTLLQHVGKESPLFRMLDPEESKGLLAALRMSLDTELKSQRDRVLTEFSLDNKEGALCRLLDELTDSNGQLNEDLQKKIDLVVKQFSLDEENSALSRLVRNVDQAQKTISHQFSLDNDESAFSRLRKMLENTQQAINGSLTLDDEKSSLSRLKRELLEIISEHDKRNKEFQEEVKVTLGSMVATRREMERSTRHGGVFEDAVGEFIQREVIRTGGIFERTGSKTGLISNRKLGDCVVELGPEHIAAGAKIVVEAKQDQSFDLPKAREYIDQARKNRGASVGLFVSSKRTSPLGMDDVCRLGQDVFVIWDPEDPSTDVFLKVGLTLATGLCVRPRTHAESRESDFDEIEKAINEMEKQTEQLSVITKGGDTISKNVEIIQDRTRITRKKLEREIDKLRNRMCGLRESVAGTDRC